MDSLSRSLNNHQEIASEPKKAENLDLHHNSSRQLLALCHHHSLTTVRLTCEGDLHEPNFPQKLKKLTSKIKILVSNDKRPIKVTKVEPWNSVRVTFNLPNEAAQRLRQLAEHGDADLRQLGILSIQLEGQQVISLRLSNQNSANSGNNLTCNNIDQVNSSSSSSSTITSSSSSGSNDQNNISLLSASSVREPTPNDNSNNKYPYGQINGAIGDESSNGSSSNSCLEPPPHVSSSDPRTSTLSSKSHSFHHLGSGHENASSAQSLPPSTPSPSTSSTITLPASNVAPSQPQKVYFSQTTTTSNRAGSSLLLSAHQPTNKIGSTGSSQIKASFQAAPTNNDNNNTSSKVLTEEQNGNALQKKPDSLPSAPSNAMQIVVQPAVIQSAPFSSAEANMVTSNVARPFAIAQSAAAFSANIRNTKPIQFNGPRPHHLITSSTTATSSTASSPSQKSFISSQKSVPQASLIQSFQSLQMPPVQKPQDGSNSSLSSVVEPPTHANKSLQPPFDHNANYVNSSSSAPSTLPLYQSLSTNAPSQQQKATSNTSTASDRPPQLRNAASYQPVSSAGPSQQTSSSTTTSDILGSSVDAVDDEDLLASVTATGAHSIDFNNFTDLNDLNLLSMLEEMETANQASTSTAAPSSSTMLNSTTVGHSQGSTSRSESSQQSESSTAPATVTVTPPVASVPAKMDPFRSPNVIAPQSTQPMPFFLAQQQSQQQAPTKVGPTVVSAGGQPILINSSTGAVLNPASQHLSQQIMASTSTATSLAPSTMYPFTSMQHASLFTNKQQGPQPRHVIVPVRHMPPVRAAASQQVPLQQQSVPMIRALQPTVSSPSDLLIQQSGQQQALFRPMSGQFVRQQLPPTSNVAATLSGKPQQQQQQQQPLQQQAQQIVIRQSVPFPATSQQVANCANSSSGQQQQNTVALSSPLLVNLLQSDAQPSTSLPQAVQQQQTFMTQAGATTQQIRLITPPGSHADGTQVMMMVRVSSAPQGTTTQLINHSALSSIVANMPSSQQVVTSIPSAIFDHQQQPSQQQISVSIPSQANQQAENSTAVAAVPAPKPKKPRKSRAKKNLAENAKAEGSSIQTSIAVTPISQVVSSISPGAITTIPLSLATTNTSRMQTSTSASTILTFPATSSIAQTLKLQTSTGKPQQQTILSGPGGQHLFNQKQRVQPVVMIATTNGNLQLSSVGTTSEGNVAISNPIVSSTGTFFIANMTAGCIGGGTSATSTSTTTTAGVQLAGNRKQIFLATKSNSFPVSSALSAGGRGNRFGNNSTSSSTPSLNASPVKFVSQTATSQVPICIAVSNSSPMSLSTLESNLSTQSPGKSSLGSIVPVSVSPETSAISTCNLVSSIDSINPIVSVPPNCASSSNVTPIVTSMVFSTPIASTTLVNTPIANKTSFATTALPSTETVTVTSQQQAIITATKSMTQISSIPIGENMSKVIPVTISTATNIPASSLLLNKLNQSTASILAASPKIIPAASFVQLSNKTTMKSITLPAVSPLPSSIQKQVLPIKVDSNLKESISSFNVISSESSLISRNAEPVVNLISTVSTEPKMDSVFPASASADTKKPPISKSSDKSFKLSSLDDVFETESTATSKLDLFAEDEPDLSAPISPSYFLAPPSAFENKSSETKECQFQPSSFSLDSDSKNGTFVDEATSSQSDLSSALTANSQKEASQATSTTLSSSVSDAMSPSNSTFEAVASLETASTSSTSSTVVTGEVTKSDSTLTTTTSVTKSNEPVQTRSNSYDSLSSYFLAKHNYSQDLPDHILEDDEDGDDSDTDMDFGLSIYPKTSRFLSGSIGSIVGTSSLSLSSTSSQSISMASPTTTSISKTSDATHSKTSSALSNALNLETTSSSRGMANESKPITFSVHSAAISDRQSVPTHAIQHDQPVQKMNQSKTQLTHNVLGKLAKDDKHASTPMNIFHSIMNGDVPANALNSESSELHNPCSPSGSLDTSTVSSAEKVKDDASSIGTKSTFQLASIVASKSYPTTTSTTTNCSTANIVSGKHDNLFQVDSMKVSVATIENHELQNASLASNCKALKIDSVGKTGVSKTSRKTPSVTSGNKNRRKTAAISDSSALKISSADSIQTTSSILSKSDLHSLLASPMTVAKPNIAISNFTTLETGSSSPSDVSAVNSTADVSNTRPLFITFKPPSQQQTISTNTSQPQPAKLVQPDSNSSTSSTSTSSAPATVVKLLVPGVNIAGSTASKLLTMAAASSGSSIVTSNPNSINSPLVSAVSGSSGPNVSEMSGNKSQSLQQMLGARYIISGPGGGQFQQIVVVKSPMNNASATNSAQQVKLISAPSSKLTAVSGASNSQPFFMVSGASGQTLLSVKPNIQTIPSNDFSTTSSPSSISITSEQQSSESESESSKAIFKTSTASAPLIDVQPSSGAPTDNGTVSLNVSHTECLTKTMEETADSANDRRTPITSSLLVSEFAKAENVSATMENFDGHHSNDSAQLNTTVDSSKSNAIHRQMARSKPHLIIGKSEPNAVHISNNHVLMSKSVVKSNSDSNVNFIALNSDTNNPASVANVLTNSMVISKEMSEPVSVVSTPRTVHIMPYPSSSEALVSGNSTISSNSNVVILRADPSKFKEVDKDGYLGLKGTNSSTITKRQIVITKPNLTLHPPAGSSSIQQITTPEASLSAVFATKSTNAPVTVATKTLPTILRQSKRKADTAFMNQPGFDYSGSIPNSEHSYSPDLDSSVASSMITSMNRTNKTNLQTVQPNQLTTVMPIIEFVDDSNDNSDIGQTVMPRPRKRARKSNLTTGKQQPSDPNLGTSLLLTEFNQIQPIDVNNHHSQMNDDSSSKPPSSMATTPPARVLRNTASSASKNASAMAANSSNKRTPRTNRHTLMQSVSVPVMAAVTVPTTPAPTVSTFENTEATLVTANSITKSRKPREILANVNTPRQTRSNRNRSKPANELHSGEIGITDNAVDESPCMSPEIEVISMPLENSHLTMSALSSDVPIVPPPMSQVNNFTVTSPPTIDRGTIMESSNSNSSTASSSSSNSLLVKRPRGKPMPSPVTTKPSLRSNSASETLASPMTTASKRRRVAKEINR